MQSKALQWSSGLVDDSTPEMGNWDEWEAFMASDQATKELDPDDAADAEELFTASEVTNSPVLSSHLTHSYAAARVGATL